MSWCVDVQVVEEVFTNIVGHPGHRQVGFFKVQVQVHYHCFDGPFKRPEPSIMHLGSNLQANEDSFGLNPRLTIIIISITPQRRL